MSLGFLNGFIRLLGSSVLIRTRVVVCNAFRLHNANELEKWNGPNIGFFLWRAHLPLRLVRKP